ncbi:DUF4276 family protein [Kineococcus gynurae]|uniref:DUF4276 family protein n=1 Tax=Kineococcus gynurae TaxID=452979 RepID=A0ABV5LTE0_9ACTN
MSERFSGSGPVIIERPHRLPRGRMLKEEHLGRAVELQRRRVQQDGSGGVLVLLDSDDDDAEELCAQVLSVARAAGTIEVVVAVREFEAWFLAAMQSLTSHRSVKLTALDVEHPEARRGAKETLSRHMLQPYRETLHQPAFCACIDINSAERGSSSFRHLIQAVGRLVVA